MKRRTVLIALLLIAVTVTAWLAGVSSSRGHATQQAAEELETLCKTDLEQLKKDDVVDEETLAVFYQVADEFYSTQNPRYTAPGTSLGILHLACLFKKRELVRCLLLDGADANTPGEDSPLLLAVSTWLKPDTPAGEITALVDTLLEGGADFAKSGQDGTCFLTQAALVCESEEVILHLISRGAQPDAYTGEPLALHGWARALEATLQKQGDTQGLLHALARGCCHFDGQYAACLELLLRHGAEVNAAEDAESGRTALLALALNLSTQPEDFPRQAQAEDMLVRLLELGADPYRRAVGDSEHPGFCAYDFLAMRPDVLLRLKERGHELHAPKLSFTGGALLAAEVCRVAVSPPPAEQLAEHFEEISALLRPTPEMMRHEFFPDSIAAAVSLLARADSARAVQCICASPLWLLDYAATLALAVQSVPELSLPKERLVAEAERQLQAGRAETAAVLVELLGRCPDAQEEISRACADPRLPVQAGGYAARLYAEGLPDARNNGVISWLSNRNRKADTELLRQAVLLTSQERLWFGQMPRAEQQEMLALMRRLGAERAADAYEQICRYLDNPEKLDELFAPGDEWKYELEVVTARFILENKHAFGATKP